MDSSPARTLPSAAVNLLRLPFVAVYTILKAPSIVFLLTLSTFMFFPPDVPLLPFDRLAFAFLLWVAYSSTLFTRTRIAPHRPLALAMGGMLLLSFFSALTLPFDIRTWSFLANKFIVPYSMFFMAGLILRTDRAVKHFFWFAALSLSYLIFTSVVYMAGLNFLVFPKYIGDSMYPRHIERARGPFLQAVANGTALVMLGLLCHYWFQKKKTRGGRTLLFFAPLPIAVLLTMTRAVWLSFLLCVFVLFFRSGRRPAAKIALAVVAAALLGVFALIPGTSLNRSVAKRFSEEKPLEFRFAVYEAGCRMFAARPVFGWGVNQTPKHLVDYTTSFHLSNRQWVVHNTYLEVLIEHGIIGFVFFGLIIFYLLRLGRNLPPPGEKPDSGGLDSEVLPYWRLMVVIYLLNGMFVSMSYQFINALLFTVAGMIHRAETQAAAPPDSPRRTGGPGGTVVK